jgi:hypothetical protein
MLAARDSPPVKPSPLLCGADGWSHGAHLQRHSGTRGKNALEISYFRKNALEICILLICAPNQVQQSLLGFL